MSTQEGWKQYSKLATRERLSLGAMILDGVRTGGVAALDKDYQALAKRIVKIELQFLERATLEAETLERDGDGRL